VVITPSNGAAVTVTVALTVTAAGTATATATAATKCYAVIARKTVLCYTAISTIERTNHGN